MNFIDKNIIGADVSFYQDNNLTPQQIDFTKMVLRGARFVIIRAGQNTWPDQDFQYNWTKAKEAGLLRGSYWLYDSRSSPESQAELFASLFSSDPPEMELWLDLEEHYGGYYAGYANWKRFLRKLQQLMPNAKIGIYTSYYYILGKIPLPEYAFFLQFVLWIAWYTNNVLDVRIPAPWTSALFWQWGTPPWGLEWGCESREIDQNKFNGTLEDFNRRYDVNYGDTMKIGTLKIAALNYRDGFGTSANVLGQIHAGDQVVGTIDPNRNWFIIDHLIINGVRTVPSVQSYCSAYNSPVDGYYSSIVDYVPPPPSEITLKHVIEVFSDGSLVIDGSPYP